MCNITTATSETVSRAEFENIRGQIETYLEVNNLSDKINYIVTTKGVPLRVSGSGWTNACLDSELTMILGDHKNNIANTYWLINPYFTDNEPFSREKYSLYLVTRLTAFTEQEIYNIIDNSTISMGNRGPYILDADSAKGWQPGGYGDGNIWLRDANTTLTAKGIPTYYEDTTTYVKSYPAPVMGYSSWGSNDGHDTANFVKNYNFEGLTNGFPRDWYAIEDPGINDTISSNSSDFWSGSRSVMINRTSISVNYSAVAQNITITPGMRYYVRGYVNLSRRTGPGGAHLQLQALDQNDTILKIQNSQVWTSINSAWTYLNQLIYEPVPGAVKVRVLAIFNQSQGVAFFDDIFFRDIPPHFTWVPGSIAETFVSTGGRSFRYNTNYGQSLVADLLRDGVSGVKGYVYEPFLSAIAHPDILFDRYTDGYNLAESYYMASNFIGWMDVVVGDPKMAPYADSLPDVNVSVEGVTIKPDDLDQDDWLSIRINVTNLGPSDVDNVAATFYMVANGVEYSIYDNGIIGPISGSGGTYLIRKSYQVIFDGEAELKIIIDPYNKLKEQNETNNELTVKLYFNSRPIPSELECLNETIYRGGQFYISTQGSDVETSEADLTPILEASLSDLGVWFKFQEKQLEYDFDLGLKNWMIKVQTNYSMKLGNYSFRIAFVDENNNTGNFRNEHRALEVLNNPPTVINILENKNILFREETVNITCWTIDLEDDIYELEMKMQLRLKPEDVSSNLGWEFVELYFDRINNSWKSEISFDSKIEPGLYQVRCRVNDTDSGFSAWKYLKNDLHVLNNQPRVQNITFSEPTFYRSSSMKILVNGFDNEDYLEIDEMDIEFEYTNDEIVSGKQGDIVWETSYLEELEFDFFIDAWVATFKVPVEADLGRYYFRTRIRDLDGNWSDWYVEQNTIEILNNPPTVKVNKLPKVAYEDDKIVFDARDSYDIEDDMGDLIIKWDFENFSENLAISHTKSNFYYRFTTAGNYTVRLMVTDQDNATSWFNQTFTIENIAPVAVMKISKTSYIRIDEIIRFSAEESTDTESDIDSLTYLWDFGDGTTGEGIIVDHSYTTKGEYNVLLVINDTDGAIDTAQCRILINYSPPPPPDGETDNDDGEGFNKINYAIVAGILIFIIILIIIIWLSMKRRREQPEQIPSDQALPGSNTPMEPRQIPGQGLGQGPGQKPAIDGTVDYLPFEQPVLEETKDTVIDEQMDAKDEIKKLEITEQYRLPPADDMDMVDLDTDPEMELTEPLMESDLQEELPHTDKLLEDSTHLEENIEEEPERINPELGQDIEQENPDNIEPIKDEEDVNINLNDDSLEPEKDLKEE
jgi:hypothetical protein